MRISGAFGWWLVLMSVSPNTWGDPKTADVIFKENAAAVVHVAMNPDPSSGNQENSGSGFIISPEGFALTAKHLLSGYVNQQTTPIRVKLGSLDAKEVTAEPIPMGETIDVALLRLRNPTSIGLQAYPFVKRGNSANMVPGNRVVVVGFSLTSNNSVVEASIKSNLGGGLGGELGWELNAPGVVFGMSGAPVFDTDAKVVGIITGGLENTSIANMYPEQLLENFAAIARWKPPELRWPSPDPQCTTTEEVEHVADTLSNGPDDIIGQQMARALIRDIYEVVSARDRITTDPKTTASIHLSKLDIAFLQGQNALIKLKKFSITDGAKQLRSRSHAIVDNGRSYLADAWVYLHGQAGFMAIEPVFIASDTYWPLPPGESNRELYQIAYYDKNNLISAQRGYVGLTVADVAGTVDVVNLFIGGKLRSIRLSGIYLVCQTQPPALSRPVTDDVLAVRDPRAEIVQVFAGLIEHLRSNSSQLGPPGQIGKFLRVWGEAITGSSQWSAERLQHVHNDVFVTYKGAR
jgi:Trypsin-like peptidase domain